MKKNRSIWLWISAAVVTVAVIVGGIGLLLPRPAATPPDSPGDESTSAPVVADGPCEASASSSTAVPADLRWEASLGVTWPVSDSAGPTSMTDGFPACFARSPVGAALAAVAVLYSNIDHDPVEAIIFYTADSPGRAALIASTAETSRAGDDAPQSMQANGITLAGFQVAEFSNDRATVRLIFNSPKSATGFRGIPFTLVWLDDDWRLKPLDDGTLGEATDALKGQFVEWGER